MHPASSLPKAEPGIVPSDVGIPDGDPSQEQLEQCPDVLVLSAVLPEGFSTAFPFLFRTFLHVCDLLELQGDSWLLQLDNFRSFWNCRVVWAALPAVPALGLSLLELQQENDGEYPAGEYPGTPGAHPSTEGSRREAKGREGREPKPGLEWGIWEGQDMEGAQQEQDPALCGFCRAGSCPFPPKITDFGSFHKKHRVPVWDGVVALLQKSL